MPDTILWQMLTLSLFTLFIGICFCDGFNLHIGKKIAWFIVFAAISIYILRTKEEFDLKLILPIPLLSAILLCLYEKYLKAKG
ncbi:MAG: hypothetical protein NT033_06175 [Candidatus Omnitrophica bacterium]|nr:hypothetical protein [Candidatus Omnitrophota bacterium]